MIYSKDGAIGELIRTCDYCVSDFFGLSAKEIEAIMNTELEPMFGDERYVVRENGVE